MNDFRPYLLTWVALLALLGVIVAAAALFDGLLASMIVLAGALCMIALIITLFMGLRSAGGLLRVYATGGVLWLGFLIVLTLADYLTR
ncbi:oxidase [Halomonas stenophila]|uniref:Cytochrome c oxidase subunit 4 n=1 Tax=Halomonas stenophila TaxID=795312 RepID=A0A7W5ET48_9GAMM|nr:oxidase [Halomonas stenophila]MBB3230948.1 cytochrome c oxidase subunit 4 [Halomonas stenophila]